MDKSFLLVNRNRIASKKLFYIQIKEELSIIYVDYIGLFN